MHLRSLPYCPSLGFLRGAFTRSGDDDSASTTLWSHHFACPFSQWTHDVYFSILPVCLRLIRLRVFITARFVFCFFSFLGKGFFHFFCFVVPTLSALQVVFLPPVYR